MKQVILLRVMFAMNPVHTEGNRFDRLLQAIEAERRHEEQFFSQLSQQRTLQDRVKTGFVWYPVVIQKKSWTIGEYLDIRLEKTGDEAPHRFTEGVAVHLFNAQPDIQPVRGIVASVRGTAMRLLVAGSQSDKLDGFDKGLTGIELVYDDRPYRVMEEAIRFIQNSRLPQHQTLKQVLTLGDFSALSYSLQEESPDAKFTDTDSILRLNPSQQEAIELSCKAPVVGIIHGPPGTGKTTALIGLAATLLRKEKRLLLCAPSNTATDLLTERLIQAGIRTLRVGNISRIHDNLLSHTIEESVRNHPDWVHIKKVRQQATETERKAEQYRRHFGSAEWEERKSLKKEARDLQKWANELERRLTDDILHEAQAITTTLIGASHHSLEDMQFETVIIDEASQATEAECWNAIRKGKRVLLAGDHKQLPPVVKSKDAAALGMDITLLDIMAGNIPHSSLLRTQYRMHDTILGFSNQRYYNDQLVSHPGNATHTLRNDIHPLVFIDTAGCGFEEEWNAERQSYANPGEYFLFREHLLLHRENYLGESIGIISPYAEQIRWIRHQTEQETAFAGLDIEINTIDGFQGQEKDIMYISLVRSNDTGEIGFLKDERRLNVALTRARKKAIIIGDSATLGQHGLYTDLLMYVEKQGLYDSGWNYMS